MEYTIMISFNIDHINALSIFLHFYSNFDRNNRNKFTNQLMNYRICKKKKETKSGSHSLVCNNLQKEMREAVLTADTWYRIRTIKKEKKRNARK